jgi:transcriptional regulator with XRE-family HTH domain
VQVDYLAGKIMFTTMPESLSTGSILRHWRKMRHLSQMDLAGMVNISPRHLSFVETGRARASSDLLLDLAQALQLPYRHANTLLMTAGYAPRYSSWSWADEPGSMIHAALEHMLAQHEPYPSVVSNRTYDIVAMNDGYRNALTWLLGETGLRRYHNIYRLTFARDGLRPFISNWERVERLLLKRLREEALHYQNADLLQLYEACRVEAGDAAPQAAMEHLTIEQPLPVVTLTLRKDDVELEFFSAITTFGTAIDVTLQELKIESLFPANTQTRSFFQST